MRGKDMAAAPIQICQMICRMIISTKRIGSENNNLWSKLAQYTPFENAEKKWNKSRKASTFCGEKMHSTILWVTNDSIRLVLAFYYIMNDQWLSYLIFSDYANELLENPNYAVLTPSLNVNSMKSRYLIDVDQFIRGEQHMEFDTLIGFHASYLWTASYCTFDERKLVLSATVACFFIHLGRR